MTDSLFSALVLGLIGGVIPGPVLTAIFTEISIVGAFILIRISISIVYFAIDMAYKSYRFFIL